MTIMISSSSLSLFFALMTADIMCRERRHILAPATPIQTERESSPYLHKHNTAIINQTLSIAEPIHSPLETNQTATTTQKNKIKIYIYYFF